MSKVKTRYRCSHCGALSLRYSGKCYECGSWGTMVEETIAEPEKLSSRARALQAHSAPSALPKRLSELEALPETRISTGIEEFNRVLGGGLMPASVVLIGGEPGIGKSTLMLQIAPSMPDRTILYVSAEESVHQIKSRAERMGLGGDNLFLLSETQLELILESISSMKPDIIVIDSIQTIFSNLFESSPGSVSQVRECTSRLMHVCKRLGASAFIIGHITKDGAIAGPKVLEHIVDTVLQFEGESNYHYRILRALKNRFGSTNEIGVFEMTQEGLREVQNPSELFLRERSFGVSGSCVTASIEGTRPILVEVQALVSKTNYAAPQRVSSGFDIRRLSLLLAVLEKRVGLATWSHDVFLNIAGGLRLTEPAADLAVALAIVSSLRDIPADSNTVVIGEIGLSGELRAVSHLERRLMESKKLGFERALVPKISHENGKLLEKNFGMDIQPCSSLHAALNAFFA
jgi:DNA repair protein RadA/Sms